MQLEVGSGRSIEKLRTACPLSVNVKDWSDVNQNIAGGIRWLYGKVGHVRWAKSEFDKIEDNEKEEDKNEDYKKKKINSGYEWYNTNKEKIEEGIKKYGTEWFGPVLAYNGTGERAWDYAERVFEAYKYGTDPQPPYEKNKLF
ncbi:hypothetical protein BBF96_12285 [Anoxybacter fermentans]|uniref:Uncharacterized protein n=1 Tax=Anoxybacter fermentans TaxID=1323375 RepID=A0A3S9T0S9_9FIRM|nr:hypothetical protein [Anoxybacter fermentans]AZR74107.1 hypothetical protein BBF96_12285 [Anoxybacter fermentans]